MDNIKLFEKISNSKYKIKKTDNKLEVTYEIKNKKHIITCEYIFLMITIDMDDNMVEIIWSDSNPYVDIKTRNIVKSIREILVEKNKELLENQSQVIKFDILKDIYKDLLKNQTLLENINLKPEWIFTKKHKTYTEYFMITDII